MQCKQTGVDPIEMLYSRHTILTHIFCNLMWCGIENYHNMAPFVCITLYLVMETFTQDDVCSP